jgi:solute carrier family 13 (sodium-dependent dicarboxylate transporter), member 2/3/5
MTVAGPCAASLAKRDSDQSWIRANLGAAAGDGRPCRDSDVADAFGSAGRSAAHRMLAILGFAVIVWMTEAVVNAFGLKNATAMFILAVMTLFLVVIHLGFASATALASAMIPIIIAVLKGVETSGINVIGMTMLLQFVVSFGFILVVNAPQNMVAYGTETFRARDFVRTGLVLTVIAFALVLLLGATYWHWLGYT